MSCHVSLPAVDHQWPGILHRIIGLVHYLEEVEQRCCQLGRPVVRPLGVVELKHSTLLAGARLDRGEGPDSMSIKNTRNRDYA